MLFVIQNMKSKKFLCNHTCDWDAHVTVKQGELDCAEVFQSREAAESFISDWDWSSWRSSDSKSPPDWEIKEIQVSLRSVVCGKKGIW